MHHDELSPQGDRCAPWGSSFPPPRGELYVKPEWDGQTISCSSYVACFLAAFSWFVCAQVHLLLLSRSVPQVGPAATQGGKLAQVPNTQSHISLMHLRLSRTYSLALCATHGRRPPLSFIGMVLRNGMSQHPAGHCKNRPQEQTGGRAQHAELAPLIAPNHSSLSCRAQQSFIAPNQ